MSKVGVGSVISRWMSREIHETLPELMARHIEIFMYWRNRSSPGSPVPASRAASVVARIVSIASCSTSRYRPVLSPKW